MPNKLDYYSLSILIFILKSQINIAVYGNLKNKKNTVKEINLKNKLSNKLDYYSLSNYLSSLYFLP